RRQLDSLGQSCRKRFLTKNAAGLVSQCGCSGGEPVFGGSTQAPDLGHVCPYHLLDRRPCRFAPTPGETRPPVGVGINTSDQLDIWMRFIRSSMAEWLLFRVRAFFIIEAADRAASD